MVKKIGKILAIILAVILFVIILATMLLSTSKSLITKENLSSYIENSDVLNIDINTLFNLDEEGGLTLKEKITQMALDADIPEEVVDDVLRSEELNELLGDFFSQTIRYALNGGDKPQISEETVTKMINVANESLDNHINIMLEEEELEVLIDEYAESLTQLVPERQQMIGDLPIDTISNVLNFNSIYLYLIMAGLVILIGVFTRSFYKPIEYLGICMLVAGIIFVVFGCMDDFINNIIIERTNDFNAFISPLVISILTLWFKCGVMVSFSGLFLIIIYVVINRILINNKNKKLEETRRINIEDINIK